MHPRTKHVSNDSRGDDTNPVELEMEFKPRLFKNMDIQKTRLPEFKERPIITGQEFKKNFPFKYCKKDVGTNRGIGIRWILTPSNERVFKFGKVLLLQSRGRELRQH